MGENVVIMTTKRIMNKVVRCQVTSASTTLGSAQECCTNTHHQERNEQSSEGLHGNVHCCASIMAALSTLSRPIMSRFNVAAAQRLTKTIVDGFELSASGISTMLAQSLGSTYSERSVEGERKEVANSHVDRLLVQIVLQNNKAGGEPGRES